ncbi:unnamed protein product [Diatraea saccharalis]|uniref:EF-hand domain-containing protein n=1 Tax=Diatraea saccharalis TaxID=40085 RepID=A0A9N9WET3_9NEOP|nr:unnamed protein product [Diatraea saccharalis]
MVSDFRKKKLVHVFTAFFDTNKSGSIDKKDFVLAIEKTAKLRGWKEGDVTYKLLQETLMAVWEGIQSSADADKDGQVTLDEWISMWDNFSKNPAKAADWQRLYAKCIFQLEDSSNDGAIDSEEFSSVYASLGLDKVEATAAFGKMAQGKDKVNWEEFEKLWNEYFASEDVNAPGNFIFGKTSY